MGVKQICQLAHLFYLRHWNQNMTKLILGYLWFNCLCCLCLYWKVKIPFTVLIGLKLQKPQKIKKNIVHGQLVTQYPLLTKGALCYCSHFLFLGKKHFWCTRCICIHLCFTKVHLLRRDAVGERMQCWCTDICSCTPDDWFINFHLEALVQMHSSILLFLIFIFFYTKLSILLAVVQKKYFVSVKKYHTLESYNLQL